ncbi:MAG TPA: hypothetical protein EYP40_09395 [Chromatiales bacterium]|nr:hypothetical protein [Chromatiales bacterium]
METPATLILSVLFASIGLGYLVYGRRQQAVVPLVCGVTLLLLPVFLSNVYALLGSGIVVTAIPRFVRL